jgi:hypothetical protein
MKTAQYTFMVFSILFQPLYLLMLLMYFDQLKTEEDTLARVLDIAIIALGIVFMSMQAFMLTQVWKQNMQGALRRVFRTGLVVWFFLEVVLSYWWCFVTGADPLWEHTPFVLIFLGFNAAQYWALRRLGVLGNKASGGDA